MLGKSNPAGVDLVISAKRIAHPSEYYVKRWLFVERPATLVRREALA